MQKCNSNLEPHPKSKWLPYSICYGVRVKVRQWELQRYCYHHAMQECNPKCQP